MQIQKCNKQMDSVSEHLHKYAQGSARHQVERDANTSDTEWVLVRMQEPGLLLMMLLSVAVTLLLGPALVSVLALIQMLKLR